MYAEERQQAIASLVISQGRASVADLAQAYDVTTETVRRDLAVLDKAGVLRRGDRGAAAAPAPPPLPAGGGGRPTPPPRHKNANTPAPPPLFSPPPGPPVLPAGGPT